MAYPFSFFLLNCKLFFFFFFLFLDNYPLPKKKDVMDYRLSKYKIYVVVFITWRESMLGWIGLDWIVVYFVLVFDRWMDRCMV